MKFETKIIGNQYLLLDVEGEIKEGDWCCADNHAGKGFIQSLNKTPFKTKLWSKILAATPRIGELPLLPPLPSEDELSNNVIVMAQQYALDKCQDNMASLTKVKLAVEHGYKAAKADKMYSLEDMREAIAEAWNSCEDNEDSETFSSCMRRIIQSLSKPKVHEFVPEMEKQMCNCAFEGEKDICIYPNCAQPKILNGVMQGLWT